MKKNVAGQTIGAELIAVADGAAFTGAVSVFITGNNGTQAAGSVGGGTAVHKGNGYHSYAPSQAETNFDHIAFTFTAVGAIAATVQVYTNFPQSGDAFPFGAPPSSGAIADAVWDEPTAGHTTPGSTGQALIDIETKTAALPSDPADQSALAALIAAVQADTDDIQAKIGVPVTTVSGDIAAIQADVDGITTAVGDVPTAIENADALLNRDMAAVSDTNARSPLNAFRFLRNKWSILAALLTVTKEDDATTAWTSTLTTTPAADPVTASDPT